MQKCGFCSVLSGLLRRAMCVSSRRGSSESYYRELGDQDTLKIEDRSSGLSDDSEEIIQEIPPSRSIILCSELDNISHNLRAGRFMTLHKRRKRRLKTRSLREETALLDDLQLGQVQCALNMAMLWKFNAFTLDNVSGGRCLPVLCVHLFHKYGLISHFNLDAAKVWKLFTMIEEGYHSTNPYHNSIHAADVTQAMHCFLQQKRIREHMEPLEIMASLLAAIAHDLDHPGVNQPFLIATSNHLAALYNNTSVLENHHWRAAISCIRESGLLNEMQESQPRLEKHISSLILATDITRQQEYLTQFKTYLDTNTLDLRKLEHRHLVLQMALKCADISNPCRPWDISRKWSLKVCEEFFRQGDYERRLNLPVTALCDRHTTSIPKIQTGFFKYVVTPLITEWHRFLKNHLSAQMLRNLLINQTKWESLVAQETAEEIGIETSDTGVVDEDLESCSGNISDSSEMLLPLRRRSLNPTKQVGLKEQLRRFSVPLNVFQDSKFKSRDKSRASSIAEPRSRGNTSPFGSEHSLHSQRSSYDHCQDNERVLSSEKLLPDSTITSITTPVQATRLNTVIKEGGSWKLIRQQTFPPAFETSAHAPPLTARRLHTSNEDAIYPSRQVKTEYAVKFEVRKEGVFSNLVKLDDINKTDNDDASDNSDVDVAECTHNLDKENKPASLSSSAALWEYAASGNQLRVNLTGMHLDALASEQETRRRKSVPADNVASAPKEKRSREVTTSATQLLQRTLSGKESWTQRRGSAPAPVAPSELRNLASAANTRHSTNGARRKVPTPSCQQWMVKTSHSFQERTLHHIPRRSSLPVEVLTGVSTR
ncbi:dual specificity calcium/calmodulin-dependent 3',5'-cyclic nucleotide phosphodiesterase 1C-like [Achroia grisella]|uniref:dual specificity calcium/calmodulin-dependent 3',5'-cyclic nucleotide phosphodiesterase 1C-like n=1 Tax=Achroia grisella TaxID=688607 RepID=UPI0027D34E01|nr:dual specificity calcium/calmodulin-dependent 3',5'-cyclic nucleotide phosphodiesterase 1C-like [Achroia grisella]